VTNEELAERLKEDYVKLVGDREFETDQARAQYYFEQTSTDGRTHGNWSLLSEDVQEFIIQVIKIVHKELYLDK
jgi:hypothetical protein